MNKEAQAQNTAAKETGGDSMELYTVADVADLLQVKKNYIYELIYKGQLQAFKLSERRFRITRESLNEYLNSRSV